MNILVIRMHRFGDILQLTPMLQGLKNKYPSCRITFFTSSEYAPLLTDNQFVDEIISIPEQLYRYHIKFKPVEYARIYNEMYDLISYMRGKNFQLIINRHYEFGAVLSYLLGAEQVLGPVFSPKEGAFSSDPVSEQLAEDILTKRKRNRRNLVDWSFRIAGLKPGSGRMFFPLTELDIWSADSLLSEYISQDAPLVAIQMGAAKSFRQWGTDRYFRVIQWLIDSGNMNVALLGTKADSKAAEVIRSRLGRSHRNLADLTGKTDFKTLGAILHKCKALITGDTGTMHMAASVGTKIIAIFYGAAYPWETGPYGNGHLALYADLECAPCFFPENCKRKYACRDAITPEHIFRAWRMFESQQGNRAGDYNVPIDNVKIYCTSAMPGAEQTLVPVDKTMALHFLCTGNHSLVPQNVPFGWDVILKAGDNLLESLYRNNWENFMELFSRYIDQWITLISYLSEHRLARSISQPLTQGLHIAIAEAARAIKNRDYTSLSDLLHYDFPRVEEKVRTSLTCTSSIPEGLVKGVSIETV